MRIVIPTLNRPSSQITYQNLPEDWRGYVTFVCGEKDKMIIQRDHPDIEDDQFYLVEEPITIATKRQVIINNFTGRILMMDDDLRFASREGFGEEGKAPKLQPCQHLTLSRYFDELERMLGRYAHVGISSRSGNNRKAKRIDEATRMGAVLGYNLDIVKGKIDFTRLEFKEDMDVILQLLRLGYPNGVLNALTYDDVGHNGKGGCSSTRSLEASDKSSLDLHALHPNFVKVVDRKYKSTRDRKEVIVQWKKAYAEGQSNEHNQG